MLGAVLSGSRVTGAHPMPVMGACAGAAGLGLILSAVATPANGAPAWVAIPCLALTGLGSIGYLTTANTALQLRVPDALVGRVMGLWVVVNAGTAPLGSLALGGATERLRAASGALRLRRGGAPDRGLRRRSWCAEGGTHFALNGGHACNSGAWLERAGHQKE